MAGYLKGLTDLDNIFRIRQSGDPIRSTDTGYQIAGVDIRNRYYPKQSGTTAVSTTGYITAGVDLNQIFDPPYTAPPVTLLDEKVYNAQWATGGGGVNGQVDLISGTFNNFWTAVSGARVEIRGTTSGPTFNNMIQFSIGQASTTFTHSGFTGVSQTFNYGGGSYIASMGAGGSAVIIARYQGVSGGRSVTVNLSVRKDTNTRIVFAVQQSTGIISGNNQNVMQGRIAAYGASASHSANIS